MNGRYLYQVGDKVRHFEHIERVGVITELLTHDEYDPVDAQDPDNPWYRMEWYDEDGNHLWTGFEHETSLLPEFTNPIPVKFIGRVYFEDNELWKRLMKEFS
jgi:hypothetical protein